MDEQANGRGMEPVEEQSMVSMCQLEHWRVIEANSNYEVSNFGNVRRRAEGRGAIAFKRLTPKRNVISGYFYVWLYRDGKSKAYRVHCLVAKAFIGPCPEGKEVNHKDLDKSNNCDWNLEYKTHKQNMEHAWLLGHTGGGPRFGRVNGSAKLTLGDAILIRKYWREKRYTCGELAKRMSVGETAIRNVIRCKTWNRISC